MWIIRSEQMAAFRRHLQRPFEQTMLSHLRTVFPEQCETATEAGLLQLIRTGISQASEYGINLEDDVRRYLEYVVMYGPGFEASPKFPWAEKILTQRDVPADVRMNWMDEYDQFVAIHSEV